MAIKSLRIYFFFVLLLHTASLSIFLLLEFSCFSAFSINTDINFLKIYLTPGFVFENIVKNVVWDECFTELVSVRIAHTLCGR